MEIRVREVREGDLPALLSLYRYLHPGDDPLPDESVVRSTWDEIQSNPREFCFVAEAEGALVGSCRLTLIPGFSHGCRPQGVIESVVTHISYRRRGIGTQLLNHATQLVWDANGYKATLSTGSTRPETHRFYEQAGFQKGEKTAFVARPPKV